MQRMTIDSAAIRLTDLRRHKLTARRLQQEDRF